MCVCMYLHVCVCVCVTCNNGSSIWAWEVRSIMSQTLLEVNWPASEQQSLWTPVKACYIKSFTDFFFFFFAFTFVWTLFLCNQWHIQCWCLLGDADSIVLCVHCFVVWLSMFILRWQLLISARIKEPEEGTWPTHIPHHSFYTPTTVFLSTADGRMLFRSTKGTMTRT